MLHPIARLLSAFAAGLALFSSSAFAGFTIQGTKLIDGNGTPFVMRGVSHPYAWHTASQDTNAEQIFKDIASTGANTVRLLLLDGFGFDGRRTSGAEVADAIKWAKANKLVTVLEVQNATGYGENPSAEDPLVLVDNYWLSPEIRAVIDGQEDYVIINVANEPIGNTPSFVANWANMQVQTLQKMRGAGIKHTIMLDGPNWGQDWTNTMRTNAQTVAAADNLRNTIFSIHMYASFPNATAINNYINDFKTKGLPLVIGEFGSVHDNKPVDVDSIMAAAQANSLGYLGWSWAGNGSGDLPLDMTVNFNVNSLSPWGNRIINGTNGIRQTSQLASIFTQPTDPIISQGKTASATSTEGAGFEAAKVLDNNAATRWASLNTQPTASLTIDLGGFFSITGLKLAWEAAYASAYNIQVSSDNVNFSTPIFSKTNGTGGNEVIKVVGQGRYVRLNMTTKFNAAWGYSLWDVAVYGTGNSSSVGSSSALSSSLPASSVSTSISPGSRPNSSIASSSVASSTLAGSSSSAIVVTNVSQGKTFTASTIEGAGLEAAKAGDGNTTTRWASNYADNNWLSVDLGGNYNISRVKLVWEAAYAKSYNIQISSDGANWITLAANSNGQGGTETLNVSGTGRYVRLNCLTRATAWGCSVYEFEVYGSPVNVTSSTPASVAVSSSSAASSAITAPTLLSLNKTITASTIEALGNEATKANDGNGTTRWASSYADANWISIDLGASYSITSVKLNWEAAYGKSYQIQTFTDGVNWTSIYTTTTGTGGNENLSVSGTGRYVRMNGTARGTVWGYSLYEFEVWGRTVTTSSAASSSAAVSSSAQATSSQAALSSAVAVSSKASTTGASSSSGSVVTTGFSYGIWEFEVYGVSATNPGSGVPTNVALNKLATASTTDTFTANPNKVCDGDIKTRWSSEAGDDNWVMIDLAGTYNISRVVLKWEFTFGRTYEIQVSMDKLNWQVIYSTTTGNGGVEDVPAVGQGRYVRMRGIISGYNRFQYNYARTVNQCNVNGAIFNLCAKTDTGWGWEDNKSCIGPADCKQVLSKDVAGGSCRVQTGGTCPAQLNCPAGIKCGCYNEAGLGANKVKYLAAGADRRFLASAMGETNKMDALSYPLGDVYPGNIPKIEDPFNAGAAKQSWGVMRFCHYDWQTLGPKDYLTSTIINTDKALDVQIYTECRAMHGDMWLRYHRGGNPFDPNSQDILNFIAAYNWTVSNLAGHECDDTRFWTEIPAI